MTRKHFAQADGALRSLSLAAIVVVCSAQTCAPQAGRIATTAAAPARTYWMGFSVLPPRPDVRLAIRAVDLWSRRADAAIMQFEPPWGQLLDGVAPEADVIKDKLPLLRYYRSRGLTTLVVMVEPENGLGRDRESDSLVARHRSITEPAVQELYRRYVTAVDTILHPQFLGLAAETNLIRLAAPRPLYAAIVRMTNDAASDARARRSATTPFVSVQVDVAWGRMPNGHGYVGVADDMRDFAFTGILGLSSYPYLGGFTDPQQIPADYYARLGRESGKRVMVVEGGWASGGASVGAMAFTSSPALQARYIARQATLLDEAKALALFQLTFADLDLRGFPRAAVAANPILPLFTTLGLVDANLRPKPSLATWDSVFARPWSGAR